MVDLFLIERDGLIEMSDKNKKNKRHAKHSKVHFLEDGASRASGSTFSTYKSIRKQPVPSGKIHEGPKKKVWDWRDEIED